LINNLLYTYPHDHQSSSSFFLAVDSVKLLIELGANANVKSHISGATPLHCAVQSDTTPEKRIQIIQLLLEKGKADASLRDTPGALPFDYCREDDGELLELLQPVRAPPTIAPASAADTSLGENNIGKESVRPESDPLPSACQKS
jgi:ankyrin repeat protein